MTGFQAERLIGAIATRSGAELALADALRYGEERTAFGRPIGTYQVWRHTFVDLATELEAGKWLCYRAADLFDRRQECVREVSMAKLFCGELAIRVIDRCLQFHGGYGYIEEFPIARAWRDVRLITIGGGTSEVMKEIIAKRLGWG